MEIDTGEQGIGGEFGEEAGDGLGGGVGFEVVEVLVIAIGVEAGRGFVELFEKFEGVAVGEAELGEAEAGMEGLEGA